MRKFFLYITLFIYSWIYAVKFNTADWDLWARLGVGKTFFQLGHVLNKDFLSYTVTKPQWIDHEWGAGYIFYVLSHYFGDVGLIAFKIFAIFTIIFLITKIVELKMLKLNQRHIFMQFMSLKKDDKLKEEPISEKFSYKKDYLNLGLFLLFPIAAFNGIGASVRCQLFTFIFFTLWIYVLERVRRGETRLLWIIPVTSLIWANIHGGFVAGLGLLGIYGIGEFLNKRKSWKNYFITLIPATLVTLINPYGIDYWFFIAEAATMRRPTISEWQSLDFLGPLYISQGFKLFIVLMLLTVVFYAFKMAKEKINVVEYLKQTDKVKMLLFIVMLYLGVKHIKHQTFFVITALSFLYHDFYNMLSLIKEALKKRIKFLKEGFFIHIAAIKDVVVYSLLIIAGSALIITTPMVINLPITNYPVGAYEFIKQNNLRGNLLTVFHWGSYATWKLYPQNLVAMDGRYEEVYSNELNDLVDNFMYQKNRSWNDFIKKYHTDIIVVDRSTKGYLGMQSDKRWKEVYAHQLAAVFVPVSKVRNNYIIPELNQDEINKNKYITEIDFVN